MKLSRLYFVVKPLLENLHSKCVISNTCLGTVYTQAMSLITFSCEQSRVGNENFDMHVVLLLFTRTSLKYKLAETQYSYLCVALQSNFN